ncbi:pyridoxal-phosphate dependent enzyme [Sarocladium strictum]
MADSASSRPLNRASVIEAHDLIRPFIHKTPVLTNSTLSNLASTPRDPKDLQNTRWAGREPAKPKVRLWFKCENLQRVGAFKIRGASHAVERLKQDKAWVEGGGMKKGVVTHSSGNHAQALALAARTAGIPAHIVMPDIASPLKKAATAGYGANITFCGNTAVEREAAADKVVAETGARLVPPYDHPDIVLGQGTTGLELQEQVAEEVSSGLNAIMTPVGGGGLLSGVSLSCEGTGIQVFGAEPADLGADDCKRGFESGKRVESVSTLTVAEGLRTPVGKIPWSIIYERRLVRDIFTVTDTEIIKATQLLMERAKLYVEPSAAVPLAVVLFNEEFRKMVEEEAGEDGWDLGLVLTGGNVATQDLGKLFSTIL